MDENEEEKHVDLEGAQEVEASQEKKQNKKESGSQFIKGAFILAVAGIICRVLGVIFRIPLTNIVGNFGMGLYQMVFPLYSLLLIVSSAGVPVAISKMIAKVKAGESGDENINSEKNNINGECKKILANSLILLGFIGLVFAVLFTVFSYQISGLQGNRSVGIIYIAIAPSVFLVCIISAFRGYFQGLQNMIPTAVSQIVEQAVKMAVGITLALVLKKHGTEWAVFGAILAVTVSEVIALGYLVFIYVKSTENKNKKRKNARNTSFKICAFFDKKIMVSILKQSLPITAMAAIFPLILVFDSLVIINLLKVAGRSGEEATKLFGIQSGAVHTLINLPAVIGAALATAVVPAISSLLKQDKQKEMRTHAALAIKLAALISIFFVVFYLLFADRIIDLLYHNAFKDNPAHFKIATQLLKIESAMVLLMGLSQVFSSMLQAGDRSRLPLVAIGIGGVAKVVFELVFITSKMGIYAVSISNVICFGIASSINTFFALRRFKIKGKFLRVATKVGILVAVYFVALVALNIIVPNGRFWIVLIGAVGTAIYSGFVLFLKIFDDAEKKVFNNLKGSK